MERKPILPEPTPGPPEWLAGDVQLMRLAACGPMVHAAIQQAVPDGSAATRAEHVRDSGG